MRFSTRAIHAGQNPDPVTGSVTVPVYLTSTYQQPGPGKEGKYVYSRTANPTRTALEECLASLEAGRYGLAFSSGMAATTTILLSLKKGDHVVAGDDIYGGTYRLFEQVLRNYGLQFTYVNPENPDNVEKAIGKNTRLVLIETPTNPLMRIVDIRRISMISKRAHALLVVDNTFMSPDVQSRLKYLQNAVGAIPGPLDCYLVLRGIKTLAVRMDRHNENARTISEFLTKQPKVEKVNYPGLPDHPRRGIIKRQMRGNGGMLSFQLRGGFNQCKKLLESLRVFTVAESLGGVESLIEHPASMTHASVPRERRLKLGISDNLIRVSVGIEDIEDLVQDLNRGFKTI